MICAFHLGCIVAGFSARFVVLFISNPRSFWETALKQTFLTPHFWTLVAGLVMAWLGIESMRDPYNDELVETFLSLGVFQSLMWILSLNMTVLLLTVYACINW